MTAKRFDDIDHASCGLCRTPMVIRSRPRDGLDAFFAVCEHAPALNGPHPPAELFILCDKDNVPIEGEAWPQSDRYRVQNMCSLKETP